MSGKSLRAHRRDRFASSQVDIHGDGTTSLDRIANSAFEFPWHGECMLAEDAEDVVADEDSSSDGIREEDVEDAGGEEFDGEIGVIDDKILVTRIG